MKKIRMGLLWTALIVLVAGMMMTAACKGDNKPAAAGDCTICHNESTVVMAKSVEWERSLHASGEAYLRSTSASCAGCHSNEGFSAILKAGQNFSEVKTGVTNPTMPNCRTAMKFMSAITKKTGN